MAEILEIFTDLGKAVEKKAGFLSGGQQNLLAIARALMVDPSVIVLDEPTAGLSPTYTDVVWDQIAQIAQHDTAVLVVEQNVERALKHSDFVHVFVAGRDHVHGPADGDRGARPGVDLPRPVARQLGRETLKLRPTHRAQKEGLDEQVRARRRSATIALALAVGDRGDRCGRRPGGRQVACADAGLADARGRRDVPVQRHQVAAVGRGERTASRSGSTRSTTTAACSGTSGSRPTSMTPPTRSTPCPRSASCC